MSSIGGVQPIGMTMDTAAVKSEVEVKSMPQNGASVAPASKTNADVASLEKQGKQDSKKENGNSKLVQGAVDSVNESLKPSHTSVKFKYHDKLNRVSIKIVDDETDEVIKEIPPEETLEMVQKMLEQAGILVDERR